MWTHHGASLLLMTALATPALAGGAWVPKAGDGEAILGYSVKTANTSWSPQGDTRHHSSWHIFRYLYQGGEVGLGNSFSFRYSVLYLDGLEGPRGDMENNAGPSELYLGLKYQLRDGTWPMALSFDVRTSYLYDLQGPYDRHLFLPDEDDIDGDADADEAVYKGVSPEWRGLLGEDYSLSLLVSRSVFGVGWLSVEGGYRHRTTNLSDEIPIRVELGYPLNRESLVFKASLDWIESVGNHSTDRAPDDRFGCSERNCFPNASYAVVGGSLFRNFGSEKKWWGEIGWNQWVWGRSSRKYEEPHLTVGRRF